VTPRPPEPARTPLERATIAGAVGYPVGLGLVAVLFRFIGERWWLTSLGLYLPRVVLAAPLLVLVPALFVVRRRGWLWTQAVAAWVLLFPLLGLVLPRWHEPTAGPRIRISSYNVDSCAAGYQAVASAILGESPDVVLTQELLTDPKPLIALLGPRYAFVNVSEQFLVASRFPIRTTTRPATFSYEGSQWTPHVVRYEVDAPFGTIAIYSVHPISPRRALSKGGRADFRELELKSAAELARGERIPVVIAGDTNLPNLSPLLDRYFGDYQDGFERAGSGFGYTFPSRLPWLRLDRIFASHELAFVSFTVGCGAASDHRCVTAELAARH
jgi:vancomycin resistance protein VanJ